MMKEHQALCVGGNCHIYRVFHRAVTPADLLSVLASQVLRVMYDEVSL